LHFPPYDKAKAATYDFIGYLNFLLSLAEPPHPSEVALWEQFQQIGIAPGAAWDARKVDTATLAAIDEGVKEAQVELKAQIDVTTTSNGLFGSRKVLGQNYLKRDIAAAMGLYGNDIEEAWYGGFVADGNRPSQLHFTPGRLPPAKFFWSITIYTVPDRFLYANPLQRYSLGDRSENLEYDADGGLTIYLGHDSPGAGRENNWLPAPAGAYNIVTRVYGPSEAAIKGDWKLPALTPVK
jgi:hypothetical protein